MKVGLIEIPALKLLDPQEKNWTAYRKAEPLISKQILAGSLNDKFDVELVNLKSGIDHVEVGNIEWRGTPLRKIAVGTNWLTLDPARYEVWGITINYLQEREIACRIISYLASNSAKIVVGGSDAFAEPQPYINAGATVVVMDKSGASNIAALQIALGETPEGSYSVKTKRGSLQSGKARVHPEKWRMPTVTFARKTLGAQYWESCLGENLKPVGAVMLDHGCDRHCDFCQTPTYKLGYQYMSAERALSWVDLQKTAGARSFICCSDQFLGRILLPNGRSEILRIVNGFRELGMPVLWGNGLELSKVTAGRGLRRGDPSPDRELVQALWGWNGTVGCAQAYIPAEHPLEGHKNYAKLLEWQSHTEVLRTIVEAGVPDLSYGVIVGLPGDNHESLSHLLEAILELKAELKRINPSLRFRATPYAVRPLPGTPLTAYMRNSSLLRFTDSAILGGFWTACADTNHIAYEEVSDWQQRILEATSDEGNAWDDLSIYTG